MTEATPQRPIQVTVAAWLIMVGSVLVVLAMFDQVSSLGSLETQDRIDTLLSNPPGSGLGLDAEGMRQLLHVVAMVSAACAAASAILGFQVLQRARSARVLLSVLAVPMFVDAMFLSTTSYSVAPLVTAAVVVLWFQPARDWFNGIDRPVPARREAPAPPPQRQWPPPLPPSAPAPPPTPPTSSGEPRPYDGFGGAPAYLSFPPPQVTGRPGTVRPAERTASPRPSQVTQACVVTWIGCALVVVALLVALVVLAADTSPLRDAYEDVPTSQREGLTQDQFVRGSFAILAGLIVWALATMGVALLAWTRRRWAQVILLACASVTVAFSVALAITVPPLLVLGVLALAVLVLLTRQPVRDWFAPPR